MSRDDKNGWFKNLDYNGFKELATNEELSIYEKIGFPNSYRDGYEEKIFQDIIYKVPLVKEKNRNILDIGPGCSNLPKYIIDLCQKHNHKLVLNDSQEMLDLLPEKDFITKIEGFYPESASKIKENFTHKFDVIICYSVFHYIVFSSDLWDFIDSSIELLADGGQMIIGDIPNISKRKRFFSSFNGAKFHKNFMNTHENPVIEYNKVEKGEIDESILQAIVNRAHFSGCDAYIVPQSPDLPMANRRDDILIRKP